MKFKEVLQEVTKDKTLVRLIYNQPKEYSKGDFIDTKHAKEELKKSLKIYGGKVIDTVKESKAGFTWLLAFKNRGSASRFSYEFDDAGRTKLVRIIPDTEGEWWDPSEGS